MINIALKCEYHLNLDFFQKLLQENINLNQEKAWHNYYPRSETGLY